MKFCCVDTKGEITQLGECPDNAPDEAFTHFTDAVMKGIPEHITSDTHYVRNGEFAAFGEKPNFGTWDWNTYQWVVDLVAARSTKVQEITSACRASILAGFDSAALGETHHYPAKETDQINLSGSILDSLLTGLPADWKTPFWCSDASGIWEFRLHTAEQIQQVGRDGKTAILVAIGKNEQLQARINLASSIKELNQIIW